jgi:dolichol-phosphate mannosyltransferase
VQGWSRSRLLMSKTANLIARILVPNARNVRDVMSGFFLVRKDVVPLEELRPRGYKILMEIIARAQGARITEVPFTFGNRRAGESKLEAKTIIDFLLHAASLSPLVKFALVGFLGALLNLTVMATMLLLGAPLDIASLLGIEAGLLFNFMLHEAWTFQTRMLGEWRKRLLGYHITSAGGFITTYGVMKGLVLLSAAAPLAAQGAGIIAGFGINYILSKWGVWGKSTVSLRQGRGVQAPFRRDKELH